MSMPVSDKNKTGTGGGASKPTRPPGTGAAQRVHSSELIRDGGQLIIEHAGRDYRLRVTTNGKLILTA